MSHPEDGRGVQQAPKYHGLINQGATCYLNSVLQVLFMTKDFREAVESSIDENSDTIDHHLRSLFSDLENKSTNTYNITKALDINTVYEQRDAAEYIEKILQQTSDRASQVFQGEWSHRTTCRKCDEETVRDEAFWHLPLALDSSSDGYRVMDGIKEFFKVSEFSGEDQMYCNKCNVKVDATAQYVMNRHPDVLILLLQRFEFDYQYMSYVKINCAVDVPSTIQLPKRQTYKLYAVVDHSGDLRGGHYTATIKDGDEDRWYNFNDSRVSLCDYQPFQVDNMERSRTAQLLFYRKTEDAVNQDHMSNNQYEDAEKTRQINEGEVDVKTGDDTAVAVSVGENESVVRDVCRGVGLSEEPGHEGNVRQTGTHRNQEDSSASMQEIEEGTQSEGDEEDMRRKAEAYYKTQNARLLSVENKQTERINIEAAESDTDREMRLTANFKPDGRKGSEGGKDKDNERLNERIGQRNVKKQTGEKEGDPELFHNRKNSGQEGTVGGERKNQEKGSGQRRVHNGRHNNQPVHSGKDTNPVKTNKHKSSGSIVSSSSKIKKTRTEAAEETSNSSHLDQNTGSLTESVNYVFNLITFILYFILLSMHIFYIYTRLISNA